MAAEDDNNFMRYVYRGEEGEIIPREATHIFVLARIVLARAFQRHPNIVEIICHEGVEKIEHWAFANCQSLRRVIMPGVKFVGQCAFYNCPALTDVECCNLEIIKAWAFGDCKSLSIDLPSAMIVETCAFCDCGVLTDVKFGSKLERIKEEVFWGCHSLERITLPLKDGLINDHNIFTKCENLVRVDLVEGELHETIASLHLNEWKDVMNEEIDSINRILPTTPAGLGCDGDEGSDEDADIDEGGKALVIQTWIRSVIGKIIHYKAEHQRLLDEIATTLQFALPQEIVMNNVLPFLVLPPHTFEEDDQVMEEDDSDDE